jgi:hypothetical protein
MLGTSMTAVQLKLKQASFVLGVPAKDVRNFVQFRVEDTASASRRRQRRPPNEKDAR